MKKLSGKNRQKRSATKDEENMQLVQIGNPEPQKTVSIREMFEQMAQKEAAMIRQGKERLLGKQIGTNA